MRLLFVGDRLPIPPQSGWEVPIARLIERLEATHELTFLVVWEGGVLTPAAKSRVEAARHHFQHVHVIGATRPSAVRAAVDEVRLHRPTYMAWNIDPAELRRILGNDPADAIFVAPVAMAGFAEVFRRAYPDSRAPIMLGLNDAIWRSYIEKGLEFVRGSIERDLSSAARLVRAPLVALLERRYLQHFDAVHVQTKREADRLRRILPARGPRLVVAPNGVDPRLLELPYTGENNLDVVFISHLVDGREKQALWFLREVWTRVVDAIPDARLNLFGQPGPRHVVDQVQSYPNVTAHGFAPQFTDVFAGRTLSVVPVQQTCGLVTKVVDSMAAGVPVAGLQALHTLDGFESGVHGEACRDGADLARTIIKLLRSPERLKQLSKTAREFVRPAFAWERTLDILEDALTGSVTSAGEQRLRTG